MLMDNNAIQRGNTAIVVTPLSLLFSMIGIITFLIIAWLTRINELYQYVMLLPFVYSIASLLSGYLYKNVFSSPVSLFIVCGYFARMVLQPLLFCLGGYVSFFSNVVTETNLIKAIILLGIENIAVFMVANLYSRHFVYSKRFKDIEIKCKLRNETMLRSILFLLICFLFFAYYYVPELQTIYVLLPTADFSELASLQWDNEMIVERGSSSRYIYSLFMFLWPITRAILPAFCIFEIYKKYSKSKKAIYLSMLCLLIPSFFLGGDNIAPFMGVMFGCLVINRLFGRKARSALLIVLALFLVLFIIVLISKIMLFQNWGGAQGLASLSQIMNAYLPGVDNIAVAFAIYDPDKLSTLFFDLYYVIPFKETIFGFQGDNMTVLYRMASSVGGQIIPWCYQLAHYFSIIGSVILTSIFVVVAYKNENQSKHEDNFLNYYTAMYLSVFISISITIYSFSIFLRHYVCVLLPIILLSYMTDNKRKIVIK